MSRPGSARGSASGRTRAGRPLATSMSHPPSALTPSLIAGRKPTNRIAERSATMTESPHHRSALAGLAAIMDGLEDLYRDVHAHPELSMQEHRTAQRAAERLKAAGYAVTTGIGGTGVAG